MQKILIKIIKEIEIILYKMEELASKIIFQILGVFQLF